MKKTKGILVILLSLLLMFLLVSCDSSDYKKATELFDSGDYETALAMFEALGEYEDSALQASICKVNIAVENFEKGELDEAEKIFKEVYENIDDELRKTLIQRYIVGIEQIRKFEGTWSDNYIYNENQKSAYTDWYSGEISCTVKPPYKIGTGSSRFSDVDWRIDVTVELSAEIKIGNYSTRLKTKTFNYNGVGMIGHVSGDDMDDMDGYLYIINEDKGSCMFSSNSKSYISLHPDSDKIMSLSEMPYNYNWSILYNDDAEFVKLEKE